MLEKIEGGKAFVDNRQKKPDKNNKNSIQMIISILITSILVAVLFNFVVGKWKNGTETEISYGKFVKMIEKKEIKKVVFESDVITVIPKESENPLYKTTYKVVQLPVPDYQLVNRLEKAGIENYQAKAKDGSEVLMSVLVSILPAIIIFGLLMFMMRGKSGMMGVGKSNAKVYVEKKTGVTFAGTGKTLLAKAVAGEANVPFFSLSGSDFVEMFVGVGASRVRDLFKQAQSMAPCIIFIDEIDAIGKSRDTGIQGGGNDEREQTLNQLLSEMDGFDTSKGLVILAATNRPEVLDKALLRPGRFDRRVIVERPDLKGRIETLKVHSKDVKMDESVDFEEIALATSGAVGSDLANMINEAALAAVKAGREYVSQSDLFEAVEVVIAGKEKKDRILGKEEKQIVAYHEVGHALVMALQKESEPVQKITIVPRTMGALGYTMQRPEEEKYLNKKDEMLADLVSFFGGRAAEEIKFHTVTTGASNDIERATAIARAMVTQYGMSEEFGLIGLESITNRYLDGRPVMNCAESTAAKVDEVVMGILKDAYKKALYLIRDNMDILDEAAQFLIEKETITGKEFMEIFNAKKENSEQEEEDSREDASSSTTEDEPAQEQPSEDMEKNSQDM